jgi:hypothetical protein
MFTIVLHPRVWGSACLAVALVAGCAVGDKAVPEHRVPRESDAGVTVGHFDNEQPGLVPRSWSIRETNPTESLATWQVVGDETAPSPPNVLALTHSENYDGTFNLAIAENATFRDLDLTVRVKAVKGEEDQGGGPIWRCKDENNYYICRFNPLESNYRIYKVVEGRRRTLDSAIVELQAGRWYAVGVTMVGDQITCYLNGRRLLEAEDDTFAGSGMVGLWTKADAVTSFDDLVVTSLDKD